MQESAAFAGVVPYVEAHTGPRRVLSVRLKGPSSPLAGMTNAMVMPNVFIDGRQYVVYWGRVSFEIPADRAVHVAAGMQDGLRAASVLLPPGSENVFLEYAVPMTGSASLWQADPRTADPDRR